MSGKLAALLVRVGDNRYFGQLPNEGRRLEILWELQDNVGNLLFQQVVDLRLILNFTDGESLRVLKRLENWGSSLAVVYKNRVVLFGLYCVENVSEDSDDENFDQQRAKNCREQDALVARKLQYLLFVNRNPALHSTLFTKSKKTASNRSRPVIVR